MVVGVSGFIGRSLFSALKNAGYKVYGCSRSQLANMHCVECDFSSDEKYLTKEKQTQQWRLLLQGMDVVINAVGIYKESADQKFSQVHDAGPRLLFDVCLEADIKVIQVSAIGADQENPVSEFLKSKRRADQYLKSLDVSSAVIYPGIVLGEGGKTTRQLSMLARLSFAFIPFAKNTNIPLISIHQFSGIVVNIVKNWRKKPSSESDSHSVVKFALAHPESMEELLVNLNMWMMPDTDKPTKRPRFIYVPPIWMTWLFLICPRLSIGAFNKQSVDMLMSHTQQVKHKEYSSGFLDKTASSDLLHNKAAGRYVREQNLSILYYVNLITLALIWIISGMSSMLNMDVSRELVSHVGLGHKLGDGLIYTGAIIDIVLGLMLFIPTLRIKAVYTQIMMMVVYSLVITFTMPIYWLHPFAPVVKNFAMMVLLAYILVQKREVYV